MTMRQCLKCESLKPRDSFYGKRWSQSYCKPCQNGVAKQWRLNNLEHVRKKQRDRWVNTPDRKKIDWRLRRRYGISIEQYEAKSDAQKNCCAICGGQQIGKRLGVDHCHETGVVRELLCDRCNTLIGRVKDDPAILDSAAAYLRKWTAK